MNARTRSLALSSAVLLMAFRTAQAQEVVGTAGGYFQNGFVGVAFTIGEPITVTLNGTGLYLTQGFHQPPDDFTTEVIAVADPSINVSAYPNPARDQVTIATDGVTEQMELRLFDATGRQLGAYTDIPTRFTIDIAHLSAGCYTLVALSHARAIATIKLTITR